MRRFEEAAIRAAMEYEYVGRQHLHIGHEARKISAKSDRVAIELSDDRLLDRAERLFAEAIQKAGRQPLRGR
jgi:hypothetical protein